MKHLLAFLLVAAVATARADNPIPAQVGDLQPTAILRIMPDQTPADQRLEGIPHIGGYEVIGEPVAIPEADSAPLLAALKSPAAFQPGVPATCAFRPGVAIRMGDSAADLLVCFGCDEAAFVPAGGEAGPHIHFTQSTRDALLALAKKLLPGDEAIQELPQIRSDKPAPPPAVPVPDKDGDTQ